MYAYSYAYINNCDAVVVVIMINTLNIISDKLYYIIER